jgi:hypothetical protein
MVSSTGTAIVSDSRITANLALGGAGGLGGFTGDGVGGGVYVFTLWVFDPVSTTIKKNKASTSYDNVYQGP